MPTKKKKIELNRDEKHTVASVFEPLLSDTFGGSKYKKYYLNDAQQIITSHVAAALQKNKPEYTSKVIRYCNDIRFGISRASSMEKVLTLLTEACLIEEELQES